MDGSRISSLGAALSDPTRAATIAALLSGTAHTSGELARACGVAPSTMSSHLNKLIDAGLVRVEAAGRYRHYSIASREVADLLERMDSLDLPETSPPPRPAPTDGLAYARSCYDHLAGQLGVRLYDSLVDRSLVIVSNDTAKLAPAGEEFFTDLGIDVASLQKLRRPMLRLDLDWTERRHHLAGSLPAAMMSMMLEEKWLTRRQDKRQLLPTEGGRRQLMERFGVST